MTSSLIFSIFSFVVNAKNHPYVGINGIISDSKIDIHDINLNKKSLGLGANVGYKINNNGLIIAPEAFFDYLNNEKTLTSSSEELNFINGQKYTVTFIDSSKTKLNYRYGARLNIGYEFNNKFSIVANYGLAAVNYKYNNEYFYYDEFDGKQSEPSIKKRGSKISSIYGLGAGYNLNKNITLKLNANLQNFDYKIKESKVKNKIMTYSAGVAYNF